jgi:hypothetical protein
MKEIDLLIQRGERLVRQVGLDPTKLEDWEKACQIYQQAHEQIIIKTQPVTQS